MEQKQIIHTKKYNNSKRIFLELIEKWDAEPLTETDRIWYEKQKKSSGAVRPHAQKQIT